LLADDPLLANYVRPAVTSRSAPATGHTPFDTCRRDRDLALPPNPVESRKSWGAPIVRCNLQGLGKSTQLRSLQPKPHNASSHGARRTWLTTLPTIKTTARSLQKPTPPRRPHSFQHEPSTPLHDLHFVTPLGTEPLTQIPAPALLSSRTF
jgi:hypothetical protein